jgi:plasmid maintenance system antidote protein VapI
MTRRPVHPGEILADELEAVGPSSAELARTLDVTSKPHLANHCRKAVDHR